MESKYLIQVLESLAYQFTNFEKEIKIEEGDKFQILSPDTIQINLNVNKYLKNNLHETNQLRILVDGVSKLTEILNISKLQEYYSFIQQSNDPITALVVLNCVESLYVDSKRTKKYPGLKKACWLHNYLLAKNLTPLIHKSKSPREQTLVGLVQLTLVGGLIEVNELNAKVAEVLQNCKHLLTKARDTDDFTKRLDLAKQIVHLLTKLPTNKDTSVHEELPLILPPKLQKLASNLGKNLHLRQDIDDIGELGSASASKLPEELQFNEDNFEIWSLVPLAGGISSLAEVSDREGEILELVKEQIEQLKTQAESSKIFGDSEDRDKAVNWYFKVLIPPHIKQELYYLLLQLKTKERVIESEVGQFINLRNYIRLKSGDTSMRKLFYDVEIRDTGNRAVLLVIDQSGSMQGKKLEMVRIAAHILATAITELGDKLAIFGFRGVSVKDPNEDKCSVTPVLFWNEKYKEQYLSVLYPIGSTPLKEAILKAREWMRNVSAKEKLVLVLTDGEPTTSTTQEVYGVVRKLMAEGIRVIGIGIGMKISAYKLKECFGRGNYVWVPDIEQLPRELFRIYIQQYGVV